MVHVFGSGHSRIMVEEMWPRYGSFPGFNPIVELSLTFHNPVIGANGHFHSRGTKFEMFAWDAGDRIYSEVTIDGNGRLFGKAAFPPVPASVSRSGPPPRERSTRRWPTARSSAAICWLIADCT